MTSFDERLNKAVVELVDEDKGNRESIHASYDQISKMFRECKSIRDEIKFMKDNILGQLDDQDENVFLNYSKNILVRRNSKLGTNTTLMGICAEILNEGSQDDVSLLRLQCLLESVTTAMSKKLLEEQAYSVEDEDLVEAQEKVNSLVNSLKTVKENMKELQRQINECLGL